MPFGHLPERDAAAADTIISAHNGYTKRPALALRATGLFCIFRGRPSCGGPASYGRFFKEGCPSSMPFGATIPEEILVEPVRQEACPPSLYPFRRLLAKGPLQRTPWALPRVLRITSRASCPRARTRNSGGLRRPGPNRAPSRPARRQSPRRRAAARPAKARAWAGWRTAGAS